MTTSAPAAAPRTASFVPPAPTAADVPPRSIFEPVLEERGFRYEVRSQERELVRTFIRRRDDDSRKEES